MRATQARVGDLTAADREAFRAAVQRKAPNLNILPHQAQIDKVYKQLSVCSGPIVQLFEKQ